MEKIEFEVGGAPVIYSNEPPKPYNPLNRPAINYKKMIIALVLFVVSAAAVFVVTELLFDGWGIIVAPVWAFIYCCVIAKRAVIWLIHLYQNKASDETRLRCCFEPSCSEYMILAIQKYGLIRGVFKGIKRLFRCHPPGGVDYP